MNKKEIAQQYTQANVRTREQQSRGAGQSVTRGTAAGTNADTKVTAGNRKDVQQGTGKLQDQIGKANRKYKQAAGNNGQHGNQPRFSDTKDSQQRRTNLQRQPSGRQQVGYQALPDSDLIGSLLGTDHHAGDMDQTALNEFKRKRKKRKGQRLG
ncbi:hypothetical protein HK413_06760 [Mucilaginibacter sp. S1162]|uniref:Uncharacterized protein n=1 Tax=Mucilaginibacter humi TaxID=2732510 RepID=A0ABX1W122_9SPHI|nr:hypothetical protein [Mucilaginibacter humi]NNU33924.1 hypothetical protein [Mucilaginibacter humi]